MLTTYTQHISKEKRAKWENIDRTLHTGSTQDTTNLGFLWGLGSLGWRFGLLRNTFISLLWQQHWVDIRQNAAACNRHTCE